MICSALCMGRRSTARSHATKQQPAGANRLAALPRRFGTAFGAPFFVLLPARLAVVRFTDRSTLQHGIPMSDSDIRWKQRFSNFNRALSQLILADELSRQRPLSPLEKQGLIQAFEFTYELAWKTLKDYLSFQGITDLVGSRDTTREAFRQNIIADGDGWMMMLTDRNRTSHTYNEATAEEIVANVHARYVELFRALASTLQARAENS
jgi:nucleotidyltransferase substrate binding protein (TIGR01987 family)